MTRLHALAIVLVLAALPPAVADAQLTPAPSLRPDLPGFIGFFDDASNPVASNQATIIVARDDTDGDVQLIAASGSYTVTRGTQAGAVVWTIVSPDKYTLNPGSSTLQYQLSQAAFVGIDIDLSGPVTFTMTLAPIEGCAGSASLKRNATSESGKWSVTCDQSALTAMGLTSPAVKAALRQLFGSATRIHFTGSGAATTP